MSHLNGIPIIPLKADDDESHVTDFVRHRVTIKNETEEEIVEVQIPKVTSESTPYQILHFLTEFDHAKETMGWKTPTSLFRRFPMHLRGHPLTVWNLEVGQLKTQDKLADFTKTIRAFKQELLRGFEYEAQLDYMRALRKPPGMSPSVFLMKLRDLNGLAAQLPDAPIKGMLSDAQLARIYVNAMPKQWRTNFTNAGKTIHNTNLYDIRTYMETQHLADPYKQTTNRDYKKGDKNKSTHPNKKATGSGSNQNNNKNKSKGQGSQKIKADDPCPLPRHDNHTWGQCYLNRFGKPAMDAQGEGQGTKASGNSGNKGHRYNTRNNPGRKGETNHVERDTNSTSGDSVMSNAKVKNNKDTQPESYHITVHDECNEYDNEKFDWRNDPESFLVQDDELETELYDIPTEQELKQPQQEQHIDLVPSTLATAKKINEHTGKFLFKSLLDHGGSHVLINRRCLPKDVETFSQADMNFKTTAGGFTSGKYVFLHDVRLPEFSYTRSVKTIKAYLFDAPEVEYDIIFGRSFLNPCRIDVLSSKSMCSWYGDEIPFHPPNYFKENEAVRRVLQIEPVRITQAQAHYDSFQVDMKDPNNMQSIVDAQVHLTQDQRTKLRDVLLAHSDLFTGKVGCYPHREFEIKLKPDAVPYHCRRPYSVPNALLPELKKEIYQQVDEGILKPVGDTEWGMPMIVLTKKDGTLRTVDDFRELNKWIVRPHYLLPRIQDMFHRRRGYTFVTTLDLKMCYYTYRLTEESTWYCVLVTPIGKFRRMRLPMGLTPSPDWAQATLEEVLREFLHDSVEVYIDDVAIFSNDFDEHITTVNNVLKKLYDNGFSVNPNKCHWAVQEVLWLGHLMTPNGLKPWPKKIEGILALDEPKTLRQLRSFIGMINFYRDFWPRRAHVLAPLTSLTKVNAKQFRKHWTDECSQAFKTIKAIIAKEVLLYYPDPNRTFQIETDASDRQLGAVITQDNKPVAFFSRKLTPAQQRYPTSDKEALCITEVLEEFRPILFGSRIQIFTDHKNLTQRNLTSQRLLHWRLLIEEFAPQIIYQKGSTNVIADTLSRFPLSGEKQDPALLESNFIECLAFYPEDVHRFPLRFDLVRNAQMNMPNREELLNQPDFEMQNFHGTELLCKRLQPNGSWLIVVPPNLVYATIAWYHYIQGHSGIERLIQSIRPFLYIPNLKQKVKEYVNSCALCQRQKNSTVNYGKLPPRLDTAEPFSEVAVDLIGPWEINIHNIGQLRISALTIIDIATTLCEIVRLENKSSQHVTQQFLNNWLARYPRPVKCIHDPGPEFIARPFQAMLIEEGIESARTTVKNPQANAICERMHKTCGDQIRAMVRDNPPPNVATAVELVDTILSSCVRALRTAVHRTMGISPGSLVFQRDMLLPLPILIEYDTVRERRQAVIDDNARRSNKRRIDHDYIIGEEVLLTIKDPATLQERAIGPFEITQVHVNGTVTIQRDPNVYERVNIRRLRPYTRRI